LIPDEVVANNNKNAPRLFDCNSAASRQNTGKELRKWRMKLVCSRIHFMFSLAASLLAEVAIIFAMSDSAAHILGRLISHASFFCPVVCPAAVA